MHVKGLWILIYTEKMLHVFMCVCACTAILFTSVCLTLITSEPIHEFTLNLV